MENLHVGIILDGNRRFAKKLKNESLSGHKAGAETVEKLLDWIKDLGIKELTLYGFSTENFNRSKKEVSHIMNIFENKFEKFKNDKRIAENEIKIRFIGKREMLSVKLQKIMKELEDKTKDYGNYIINFALAYGGRQEIVEAVKKMVDGKEEITAENLEKNLWLGSGPDLIIRTGGDKRTSNFLPWQSIYSEWFFLKKMWPEFTKSDLKKAIGEFEKRQRRFGR